MRFMINYNEGEAKMKNLSHRYNINGTRSRHGRKYKYKILNIKCVSVRSWLCNKQDLSNI